MSRQSTRRPAARGRGLGAAASDLVRWRRLAGRLMVGGAVGAVVVLAVGLAVTDAQSALLIFLGAIFASCAVSCVVAWLLNARAMRQVDAAVKDLARRRIIGRGSVDA